MLEAYINDILIHHTTEANRVPGVWHILQLLQKARLCCNLKKCYFHQCKLEFLGVDISKDRFEMDKKQISAIVEWQKLTLVCGVWEFIRFINFYWRWIAAFSNVAWPLHNLFQKDHMWQWTENEWTAFKIQHNQKAPTVKEKCGQTGYWTLDNPDARRMLSHWATQLVWLEGSSTPTPTPDFMWVVLYHSTYLFEQLHELPSSLHPPRVMRISQPVSKWCLFCW